MGKLVDIIRQAHCGPNGADPEIILIAPPVCVEADQPFGRIFDGAVEVSHGFSKAYKEVADSLGVHFFDAGKFATPPKAGDGIHIDTVGTKAIGEALSVFIKETFQW
jgi:lysophospholipase L1-like esterase